MKILFVLTTSFALKQKLCIHCKHFKKAFFSDDKYGKCAVAPIVIEDDNYDVTGIVLQEKNDHQFCSIERRYGECGVEGKLFEPKK
jgi:hypothetical protein